MIAGHPRGRWEWRGACRADGVPPGQGARRANLFPQIPPGSVGPIAKRAPRPPRQTSPRRPRRRRGRAGPYSRPSGARGMNRGLKAQITRGAKLLAVADRNSQWLASASPDPLRGAHEVRPCGHHPPPQDPLFPTRVCVVWCYLRQRAPRQPRLEGRWRASHSEAGYLHQLEHRPSALPSQHAALEQRHAQFSGPE